MNRVHRKGNSAFWVLAGVLTAVMTAVCVWHLQDIHKGYWGKPGQVPQGTIYAVQTVEYNIANQAMPSVASQALLQDDRQLLQRLVNSAYGLTGFAITRCAEGSTQEVCAEEEVLAHTTMGFDWLNESNMSAFLDNADFAVLTSDFGLGIDWSYQAPKTDTRVNHDFSPEGEVIGRLYYVRRPAPTLAEQLSNFTSDPLSTGTDLKYYGATVAAYLGFLIIFLGMLHWVFRWYREWLLLSHEKTDAETELAGVQQRLAASEKESADLTGSLSSAQEKLCDKSSLLTELQRRYENHLEGEKLLSKELNETKVQVKLFSAKSAEAQALLQKQGQLERQLLEAELEKQQVWTERLDVEFECEELKIQKREFEKQADWLGTQITEKNKEIKNLRLTLDTNKRGLKGSHRMLHAFISGLNLSTACEIAVVDQVNDDVELLEKCGISVTIINNSIATLAKVTLSERSIAEHYEAVKGLPGVYHTKKANIRCYFVIQGPKEIKILAIWDQDHAPHDRNDKNWKLLARRYAKNKST